MNYVCATPASQALLVHLLVTVEELQTRELGGVMTAARRTELIVEIAESLGAYAICAKSWVIMSPVKAKKLYRQYQDPKFRQEIASCFPLDAAERADLEAYDTSFRQEIVEAYDTSGTSVAGDTMEEYDFIALGESEVAK